MELVNTVISWVSWALAAYMVGVTLFLAANIAIGAIKTRSALWWYLIYSVVVVGMMLVGLKYLPSLVLEYANDGIEAAEPEMARFAANIAGIFDTAANSGALPPPGNPDTQPAATAVSATATSDPNAGGGGGIPPTMVPVLATPTLPPATTATPSPTYAPGPDNPEPDYSATATSQYATVQAVAPLPATPGPTPTFDIMHPPTPYVFSEVQP